MGTPNSVVAKAARQQEIHRSFETHKCVRFDVYYQVISEPDDQVSSTCTQSNRNMLDPLLTILISMPWSMLHLIGGHAGCHRQEDKKSCSFSFRFTSPMQTQLRILVPHFLWACSLLRPHCLECLSTPHNIRAPGSNSGLGMVASKAARVICSGQESTLANFVSQSTLPFSTALIGSGVASWKPSFTSWHFFCTKFPSKKEKS